MALKSPKLIVFIYKESLKDISYINPVSAQVITKLNLLFLKYGYEIVKDTIKNKGVSNGILIILDNTASKIKDNIINI